ncbi:hypothetical protein DAI22_04g288950 [Oryza sativa Japonica Group]|nr:hypothetical protein DAI22_04g288950 [Oryza sativa Japonica Group]
MGLLEVEDLLFAPRVDGGGGDDEGMAAPDYAIPPLSPTASSVVHRCARIAGVEVEQLLRRFEPEKGDQPLVYARSVVEYCSYIALCVETKRHDYLSDSEFHSLTYDMIIAWEAPDDETDAALVLRFAKRISGDHHRSLPGAHARKAAARRLPGCPGSRVPTARRRRPRPTHSATPSPATSSRWPFRPWSSGSPTAPSSPSRTPAPSCPSSIPRGAHPQRHGPQRRPRGLRRHRGRRRARRRRGAPGHRRHRILPRRRPVRAPGARRRHTGRRRERDAVRDAGAGAHHPANGPALQDEHRVRARQGGDVGAVRCCRPPRFGTSA